MRFVTTILLALAVTACATARPTLVALTDSTPVERHVLRYYQDLAALNASVGDDPVAYSLDRRHDLQVYQRIIATRFEGNLRNEYPMGIRPATQVFLLMGARGDHDLIQVIRLGSTSFDGAFERLEGLTYIFDRSSRNLLSVRGTEY